MKGEEKRMSDGYKVEKKSPTTILKRSERFEYCV